MTTWNYRVMRNGDLFAIHEVYYDENGKVEGYTQNPVCPSGESLEELKGDIEYYLEALNKPVLEYKD